MVRQFRGAREGQAKVTQHREKLPWLCNARDRPQLPVRLALALQQFVHSDLGAIGTQGVSGE